MKQVIVIGSGLGGLATGCLLAKEGYAVTLLEQSTRVGGCLQSFYRDGLRFDTGFHFVGGVDANTHLYDFLHTLDLWSLPWVDVKAQDIYVGGELFRIPCGKEAWMQTLTQRFPEQTINLQTYWQTLEHIAQCPLQETLPYWEQSAWTWLNDTISDPLLRDVLFGASLLMDLNKERLPLFEYAEIMYSFFSSTKRLPHGGQDLLDRLLAHFTQAGGRVKCDAEVTRILETDGAVSGVQLADGERICADLIVSAINPANTMALLCEDSKMRGVYRRRVSALTNGEGCFIVNAKLCNTTLPSPSTTAILPLSTRKEPVFIHKQGASLWDADAEDVQHLMLYFYEDQPAVDVLCPMKWSSVEKWQDTTCGNRGADYEAFKEKVAQQCFALVETVLPDFRQQVEKYWCSTPLTWHNYLKAPNGSAYGVSKDYNNIATTLLMPQTPLSGLYLTGQSLVLHGIMGTMATAIHTVETIKSRHICTH